VTLPTQVRTGFGRKQEGLKRGNLPNLLAIVLSIGLVVSHAFGQSPASAPSPATSPTAEPAAETQPPVAPAPAEPAVGDDTPPPTPTVSVSEHGTVTLAAQGIEITKLLELLSIKSRMNIVASEKVKALVSVSLYDVPIDEALDALLTVNGFVWERQGPFVMVYTRAEKEAMDKAKMKREPRVFTLQFLAPDDALTLVKPLLSEGGTAVSLGKVKEGFEPTIADGGSDTYAFATRVLVNDFPDVIEKAAKVLTESDVQPQQVRVEATILVTDVNEEDAFGLDISLVGKIDFAQVTGGPMAAFNGLKNNTLNSNGTYPDPVPASASAASLFPATEADPTLKMGVLANDVAVFLQMLDQVKNTTVLARPSVTVLNRQKAQVNIGAKVGYLSTTQTQTSTTQEVQYIDTGIKLTFRAFISPDGMVRMELNPSIVGAEYKNVKSVTGSGTGDVQIPNQTTQELRTNVRVKSGQTIVLGGLFREDAVTTNRQVPVLGDIAPGAFSGQADKTVRQEVIFLVTPTIVQDPKSDLDGDKALKVIDAVQAGARAGLLPFSHAQIGGHYQLQALDAWRAGDRERAGLYADQALRVAPNSPSMIQLREDIRADNAAPWRNKLDSLDLLPDYIRRKGMVLGFPQDVPKAEPTEPGDPKTDAAPVVAPPAAPMAAPAATETPAETTP
jgi:type II secretory pathway component GspD/PulD (secretin)